MLQISNNKTTRYWVIDYYLMIYACNLVIVISLVGRAGLEPTTLCLKGRYSTV